MIAYQVVNCLISQPKRMLCVLKRAVAMRRFFSARNYRLNLMIKKILKKKNKLKKCVYLDSDIYSMQI